MRSTQTFGVDFIIRTCKANKTKADIYARITVDGGLPKEISLKQQIDRTSWDSRKEEVKGRGIGVRSINEHIDHLRAEIRQKYRQMQQTGMLVTAEAIKNEILGKQSRLKGHTLAELLDYYEKIWKPKLKQGGFKNYRTTIDYIKRFVKSDFSTGDVFLSQVDGQFAVDFEHFIRMNPARLHDPCKGNGVGKHIQRFKRILNWAADDLKWIDDNKCRRYSCPMKKTRQKKLDIFQLVALAQKQFEDPALQYVKELFLYSCYTGLAYVDAMALSESDFEWEPNSVIWCKIYRAKSDEFCAVPLLQNAVEILNKYVLEARSSGRKTIFPPLTNQCINKSLKIIQAVCGIDFNLTFHIARHTFAKTVSLKNGIPLETVQMMMGHTKISTTQIYAQVDEEKILSDLQSFDDKLEKKMAEASAILASTKILRPLTRGLAMGQTKV